MDKLPNNRIFPSGKLFPRQFFSFSDESLGLQDFQGQRRQRDLTLKGRRTGRIKRVIRRFLGIGKIGKQQHVPGIVPIGAHPLSIEKLGCEEFDQEGRVMILEYPDFSLLNCYFLNSPILPT